MTKIFRLPPVTELDDQAKYALEQVELFLNERFRNLETRVGRMRVVSGGVSFDGSVGDGSGFTSAKNSTGDYTVTFDDGFDGTPSVVVTANSTAAAARIYARSGSEFSVETFIFSGGVAANADSSFTFIAHRSE